MHMPRLMVTEKDFGVTGKARYRRQRITGKMVLQVEVVREKCTVKGIRVYGKEYSTYWRDATPDEAIQIATGIGQILVPESWFNKEGVQMMPPKAPPMPPKRACNCHSNCKDHQ